MILVCKGICAPVAPSFKGQGGSAPVLHPRSGVPGYPSKCTMFFLAELQHQKRISLFLVKNAIQNYFHNVQVSCYCCVTWYETRTIFSLLYSHLRWSFCGVMLLHVARVEAGSFAVGLFVFLHSSILAFGSGHTIKQLPRGPGITRPLQATEQDQVYRLWWKLQASASKAVFRPISPISGVSNLFQFRGHFRRI